MKHKLGIDLGTYNSSAAVALQHDTVVMVTSKEGRAPDGKNFPSFVQFDSTGRKVSVGARAKRSLALNPRLVVWGVKRLVGLSYQSAIDSGETKRFKYDVERGPDDGILIRIGNERFTPSHILEAILREIKEDAENQDLNPLFGASFDEAVISIPAYYPAIRTAPILDAARQAGFKGVETIAEPTAAALQYGLQIDRETSILAFDLGAGTLDVTVLQVIQDGDNLISGELGTAGNPKLGGLDMDDAIRDYVIDRYNISATTPQELALLQDEIEKTKIRLSKAQTAKVAFPFADISLTRNDLEEALKSILSRFRSPIQTAIKQAGLEACAIDNVLLVGGPTQMPCVRRVLREELALLGARQDVLQQIDLIDQRGFPVHPMECVCKGASLKAAGVAKPACTSLAEGYGIVLNSRYYLPIIKDGSMYPIDGKGGVTFADPNAKTLTIKLAAKRADSENYTESKPIFRYEHVGDCTLNVIPTGDLHSVDVFLSVSKDKELTATLSQEQTGMKVTYKSPDLLKNEVVQLEENENIPPWDAATIQGMRAKFDRDRSAWTKKHLEDCVLMAMRMVELAKTYHHPEVQEKIKALQVSISAVTYETPREGAALANYIREFLDLLRQPEIGVIKAPELKRYLDELARITS
jgi:molecular chaperone DnaK (HSP70)